MHHKLLLRYVTTVLIAVASGQGSAADWVVRLPEVNTSRPSGRLLLLIQPDGGNEPAKLSTDAIYPGNFTVASRDVSSLAAGASVSIDTATAYRRPVAELSPGRYLAQARLDRDYSYNMDQGGAGDLYSDVVPITLPLETDVLVTLTHEEPKELLWDFPDSSEADRQRREAVRARLHEVTIASTRLSAFLQRTTEQRAWVLLPKDYEPGGARTWPVVYMVGTYSATHKGNLELASVLDMFNVTNEPSMIWVFLDFQTPFGPSLFVDSEITGPWGTALVEEFIPALEMRYRMDARANGRFLTGHSSGAWSTLWLQVRFPKFFGGAWSSSPDPLDFTAFLNTDLYAASANIYVDDAGAEKGVARRRGAIVTTIRESVHFADALGPQGGVFQNWDWVFGPRDASGKPRPLFDHRTGLVDPQVAAYWRERFDFSIFIQRHWDSLSADLDGKLHLVVGTEDDHYLEDSVYKLRDTMAALGAKADFAFYEGKTHNNLYATETDPVGLFRTISREMYSIARPD